MSDNIYIDSLKWHYLGKIFIIIIIWFLSSNIMHVFWSLKTHMATNFRG